MTITRLSKESPSTTLQLDVSASPGSITTKIVSVIVPAYNAADTLGECLEGLKHQQLPAGVNLEIIVVDDHSPDATADMARWAGVMCIQTDRSAAQATDRRDAEPDWLIWRPAGIAPASGPGATRNRGVNASTGDPLLLIDADCVPTPRWAASLLAALEDPQVAGAKGTYLTRQRNWIARFVQLEYSDKYRRMAKRQWIDFIDAYSAGYRRGVFLENGGFESAMMGDEDQELSFRLAQKGYRLKFVPEARVYHRHLTSFTRYLYRKFTIGYWKMQLLRWHPNKALGDSHTPVSQRLQVMLIVPLLISLMVGVAWPPTLWLAAVLSGVFCLSMLPFLAWVARNDWPILAIVLPMVVGRAVAQAMGLGLGALAALRRKSKRQAALSASTQVIKRTLDVVGALVGLVLAAPLRVLLSLLIRLESPGPVIFRQTRVGQHGRQFEMLKLRSMEVDAEVRLAEVLAQNPLHGPAFKMPNDPRVTRIGRFMRRWSLDELPQLWNVLRGDMSLVGPRPEEPWVVAQYTDWHRQRLAVKPGLTGPMQVNGRGDLSLDERVQLELDYIQHYSLWRDLEIILRSIPAVISGRGAY